MKVSRLDAMSRYDWSLSKSSLSFPFLSFQPSLLPVSFMFYGQSRLRWDGDFRQRRGSPGRRRWWDNSV